MRIFYIGKIEEETCDLYTRTKGYERTVVLEDLKAIAEDNIVIGYNKVTGKIVVKDREDVLKYINSKLKLSGREEIDSSSITGVFEVKADKESNIAKIRIYVEDVCGCDVSDIVCKLKLRLTDLATALKGYDDYDIELIYDFNCFTGVSFDIFNKERVDSIKGNLVKITMPNKDMFKHTTWIDSLFWLPFEKVKRDFVYDFSDMSFHAKLATNTMFAHTKNTEPVRLKANETFLKANHNMLISRSHVENKDFIYLTENCKNFIYLTENCKNFIYLTENCKYIIGRLFKNIYLDSLKFSEYEGVLNFTDSIDVVDYFYLDKSVGMIEYNGCHNILINNVVLTPEFEMQLSEKDMNSIKVVGHYLLSDFALTTKISMHNIDTRFHLMLDEYRRTYCHTLRTKVIPNRSLKCRTDEEKDLVISTIMDFTNFSSEEYNNISDTFSFMRFREETNIYSDFPLEYVEAVCFMLASERNDGVLGYSFMLKGLNTLKEYSGTD